MIAMAKARLRRFDSSAATALIAASMPPMPSPVTKRQIDRPCGLLAEVAMIMPAVMISRHASVVRRRPITSVIPPRISDPPIMPHSSIDRTTPSASRLTCHSAEMPGAAKALASTSKPSSALSPMVMITAAHCRRCMRPCSMIWRALDKGIPPVFSCMWRARITARSAPCSRACGGARLRTARAYHPARSCR